MASFEIETRLRVLEKSISELGSIDAKIALLQSFIKVNFDFTDTASAGGSSMDRVQPLIDLGIRQGIPLALLVSSLVCKPLESSSSLSSLPPHELRLRALDESMARLRTADEKLAAVVKFIENEGALEGGTPMANLSSSRIDSDSARRHATAIAESASLFELMRKHNVDPVKIGMINFPSQQGAFPVVPLFRRLPCANNNVRERKICGNEGKLTCSGCRLVRYCSSDCQKRHWGTHKIDCRNKMNTPFWKPRWETECRSPTFTVGTSGTPPQFGFGTILWGNVPAFSVINTQDLANSMVSRDLSLAFIASGDLRNVIKSVNSLPDNYFGKLKIILNDRNPLVAARNALILMVLGIGDNVEEAAEYALHLWYSVFLPIEISHRFTVGLMQHNLITDGLSGKEIRVTRSSTMTMKFGSLTATRLIESMDLNRIEASAGNVALNAIMNAPERVDYRDRFYARLKSSHRVAMEEWRTFGLVMPFGAVNAHLNRPNPTLFLENTLLLSDSASPLEGWDIPSVIKSGMEHDTTEQDIMGCLYFHVKDQLVAFCERLRRFRMSIWMYDEDAVELPKSLPAAVRTFDRVEVSNIMDSNYVGIPKVLETWGPLLNRRHKDSVLIGSFINWAPETPGAIASHSPPVAERCMDVMMSRLPNWQEKLGVDSMLNPNSSQAMNMISSLDLFNETSRIFKAYLKRKGADGAARKAGLRMREKNEVVPHRIATSVKSDWSVLPAINTDEDWYNLACLSGLNHCERFVEWTVL